MKIVIDMMGGDNGLEATIPATKNFINEHKDLDIYLIGSIKELKENFNESEHIHLIESKTIVKMDADPMSAMKDKESSLMVGIKTYLENNCDAFISAGSTGALLTAATFKIKRMPGIIRPALITPFPTIIKNKKFVMCDLGANTICNKEELNQFAIMGSIYYKSLFNDQENPRVYQLNIGTESEKGTEVNKETYELLKENKHINFKGNIEGRDPLFGEVDVLVTDGYSGNIFLKTMEGTAKAMSSMLKKAFKRNLLTMIGYLFSKKGINELKETMDYKNVGGAMLIGVNGVVIKAHGSSDPKSFLSALNVAYKLVNVDIINKIKEKI